METSAPEPWALADLPGVRGRLGAVASDLAAGLNCVWLVPDRLVADGRADVLYREALYAVPARRIDVPAPATPVRVAAEAAPDRAPAHVPAAPGELSYLDGYDDGFDLDPGPVREGARGGGPRGQADPFRSPLPGPRAPQAADPDPTGLWARLAKELSVGADDVLSHLTGPAHVRRPVIGVRAWHEPGDGRPVERLVRSLTVAVRDAGLGPEDRPLLLLAARLGDLPPGLADEWERDSAYTAVHWWWGALGRLDTTMTVAPYGHGASGPARREGNGVRSRILGALRTETVVEVSGPDLDLARELAAAWDGRSHTLADALRAALAAVPSPGAADCPPDPPRTAAARRPEARIRDAWASGAVSAWEGRLRVHPGVWHRGVTGVRLRALVSQAQQRVLVPWIEEARGRLAGRAIAHLTRPVATVVAEYLFRPPGYLRHSPEPAFLELEVGPMLAAHNAGALRLPAEEIPLLKVLVKARNVLAHRDVLDDTVLDTLCDELAKADRRGA